MRTDCASAFIDSTGAPKRSRGTPTFLRCFFDGTTIGGLAAWTGHMRCYEHSAAHFWLADVGEDPLIGSGVGDERNARIGVRYQSRSGHCLSKSHCRFWVVSTRSGSEPWVTVLRVQETLVISLGSNRTWDRTVGQWWILNVRCGAKPSRRTAVDLVLTCA